jgi:hypothetical protein
MAAFCVSTVRIAPFHKPDAPAKNPAPFSENHLRIGSAKSTVNQVWGM